ncbi:peptidylprolyl isomerase SurA [Pseudidiomarina mangrovi]|uniref:peptidylprolyl isomerase SurA n=1 Tax=Pseudidiomarina mangrovi TaxID=2487133 RepID=UPI000FCA3E31|nr:peptidylprolyl isomerase SurA [Pseudidiomarina mangrovi]CAI8152937.1 MAG: Chaperone SurA [Pseudidiomarina mangrovi]
MNKLVKWLGMMLIVVSSAVSQAQEVLDRVAVIVNDGVVLESEIQQMLTQVKRNAEAQKLTLPADSVLRVQAIDRLVLRELQMQMARRVGIEVSDAQLQQALVTMAREAGATLDEMREDIEASGLSWQAYRENIRDEMVTGEVQRGAVQRRVYVSPQEVDNLTKVIEQMAEQETEYRLGHILVATPEGSTAEQIQKARDNADILLSRLRNGADFAQAAITSSSGSSALEGGDLGWMNINAMPTLFAEVVRGKEKDTLVGPLRSGVGFHILKVLDTRGVDRVEIVEYEARHILITPSIILSDARAKEMLDGYRQQLLAGEAEFADLAREHSADPGSAQQGGSLGWSDPEIFTPVFRDTIKTTPVGEVSEPFKTEFGWHIVEVLGTRVQDTTRASNQNRAYQMLFSRKYQEELENWQQEIRDQAYIEQVEL